MSLGIIWLALIVILPPVILYLFSVNASLVFLSLCLGFVLYSFDAVKVKTLSGSLTSIQSKVHLKPSALVVDLVLLLGPTALTIVAKLRTVHGKRRYLNIIPSIFVGLFMALVVTPVLPDSLSGKIAKTAYYVKIVHYQASIVGVGVVLALIFFGLSGMNHEGKKHKHKSKKE